MPYTITPKKTNYLDINLTKLEEDLYAENDKMMMKEIRDLCHG